MCGILGHSRFDGAALDTGVFAAALDSIRHRGPDDEGFVLFDPRACTARAAAGADTDRSLAHPPIGALGAEPCSTALGHRRLAILDLSVAGHQPMRSADGRFWLTFNGEIYNYLELRSELKARQEFRSGSDTEVILAAYAAWGPAMLERFAGMFALCILDTQRRELFLARDQFGIKPLYYVHRQGQFAFASEIKALERLGLVSPTVDADLLYGYLRYGERTAGARTLFTDVYALPAAHRMVVNLGDGATQGPVRYARLSTTTRAPRSLPEAVEQVRDAVADSVRLHMRSDVPVGSCLSGGLDSTCIVTLAQRHLSLDNPMHTFSFVTDDAALNEEPYVDMVPGVIHHKTCPQASDLRTDLERLMRAHDLPFGSSSIYAQFRVFELAHQHGIKVMLDGQGADEIFGGYLSLTGARISSLLRNGQWLGAARLVRSLPRNARAMLPRVALSALGRIIPPRWRPTARSLVGEPAMPRWLNRSWFAAQGMQASLPTYGFGSDMLKTEMLLTIEEVSLPQLLRYEDCNSMHFSIESRVPFCHWQLAELALSMPEEYLISRRGNTKHVLREAMRGIIPEPIRVRDKVGFQTPEARWLSELRPWLAGFTETDTFRGLPFIDTARARSILLESGSDNSVWNPYIWRILNIALWSERHGIQFNTEARKLCG
jgi:asparagine synthase (glutamine-hydrolysing)